MALFSTSQLEQLPFGKQVIFQKSDLGRSAHTFEDVPRKRKVWREHLWIFEFCDEIFTYFTLAQFYPPVKFHPNRFVHQGVLA